MVTKRHPKPVDLPATFRPRFWADLNQGRSIVKEIKRRLERLQADTAADSYQKELLCQRAIFVSIQIETMESNAVAGEPFAAGTYVHAINALVGLLKALGLEKKISKVRDLRAYVKEQG